MKRLMTVLFNVVFAAGLCGTVVAGSIEPSGPPTAGSGMYTLQNLYDYIVSGTALEATTSFQEPASAPGTTMKSTKEIGDMLKSLYEQCPVTAADVKSGVKFFCTQSGSWGVQTGTAQLVPTPTPTPTLTPTPTPTSTITPTPTPTWNQGACQAKSGYWAPKNDGTGQSGCWLRTTSSGGNCNTLCGNSNLQCVQTEWDDTNYVVLTQYFGTHPHITSGSCNAAQESPWYHESGYPSQCPYGFITRADGKQWGVYGPPAGQTCGLDAHTTGGWMGYRICVCAP